MRDYYLDDLKPGDAFSSPSLVLTEQDVIEFAEKYVSLLKNLSGLGIGLPMKIATDDF
jgi:hypothetical protein